uniref:Cannabinoid receptor 2 n=1 Tax=Latimeria chalumnae TaxID=7897 RepID=H3B9L0_LATCH
MEVINGSIANMSHCGSNFMNMKFYMVLSNAQKKAIAALCLTIGPLTFLENMLVLSLIFTSAHLRRKPSYLFISSLAFADLLASVNFVYSFLDFHILGRKDTESIFLFKLGGVNAFFTASVCSLLLTAIDRYICIHKPSDYKTILTRRRAMVLLLGLWIVSITIAFLPLMGWNCCKLKSICSEIFPLVDQAYLTCWIIFIILLLVSIVCAYLHILCKAHKHAVYMERHQIHSRHGQARMRLDIKLAKTLVLVLAILITCWFPALSLMTYDVLATLGEGSRKVFAFCSVLCLLNSMVNPVVYALRSKEMRRALVNTFTRCKRRTSESTLDSEDPLKTTTVETISDLTLK